MFLRHVHVHSSVAQLKAVFNHLQTKKGRSHILQTVYHHYDADAGDDDDDDDERIGFNVTYIVKTAGIHNSTINTLDCDQSNYSSRIVFAQIPDKFGQTGNSAIRSADPENPVLEPNTE